MKKTLTLLLAAVAAFSMTAANFFTPDAFHYWAWIFECKA